MSHCGERFDQGCRGTICVRRWAAARVLGDGWMGTGRIEVARVRRHKPGTEVGAVRTCRQISRRGVNASDGRTHAAALGERSFTSVGIAHTDESHRQFGG
ncbi:hypothetical protein Misp02_63960 [Microtetraspora sp. NBRC 16547]|nr:hypothetical protein Misp02_63960 [Microtetraspora sp. NBRC 16547]